MCLNGLLCLHFLPLFLLEIQSCVTGSLKILNLQNGATTTLSHFDARDILTLTIKGKKNHSPSVYLTLLTMTISRNVGGSLGYASAGVYLSTGCILCPNTLHLGSIAFQ